MGYVIKKVVVHGGQLRVSIPRWMLEAKGWGNVRYVRIDDHWGDRIMITRVGDNEDDQTDDKSVRGGRD